LRRILVGRTGQSKQYWRCWDRKSLKFADRHRRAGNIAAQVNSVENIGAALQTVMERVLDEISFAAPDRSGETVKIDAAYVREHIGDLAKNADLSRLSSRASDFRSAFHARVHSTRGHANPQEQRGGRSSKSGRPLGLITRCRSRTSTSAWDHCRPAISRCTSTNLSDRADQRGQVGALRTAASVISTTPGDIIPRGERRAARRSTREGTKMHAVRSRSAGGPGKGRTGDLLKPSRSTG
jgi:hypothetical protein